MVFNFDKQYSINSRGYAYDYRSMMHYGRTAFGGGDTTILTTDPNFQYIIGTGTGFSNGDIQQINNLYCW